MAENKEKTKETKKKPEPKIVRDILINPYGKDGNYRLRMCAIDDKKGGVAGRKIELSNHTKNAQFPFASAITDLNGVAFVKLQFSEPEIDVKFVCDAVTETHNYIGPKRKKKLTQEETKLSWWKFFLTIVFGQGGN